MFLHKKIISQRGSAQSVRTQQSVNATLLSESPNNANVLTSKSTYVDYLILVAFALALIVSCLIVWFLGGSAM